MTPTQKMIDNAFIILKKELESPEMAEAVHGDIDILQEPKPLKNQSILLLNGERRTIAKFLTDFFFEVFLVLDTKGDSWVVAGTPDNNVWAEQVTNI